MILTTGQQVLLTFLFLITEILIYNILQNALNTIKHCASARAYSKALERGMIPFTKETQDSLLSFTPFKKEEKKDEKNI